MSLHEDERRDLRHELPPTAVAQLPADGGVEKLFVQAPQRLVRRSPRKPTETKRKRKQRLAKAKRKRLAFRAKWADDDDAVLTVREWAALLGVSVRQARRIIAGQVESTPPPVVTVLGDHRIGISRRNHRDWEKARARGGQ